MHEEINSINKLTGEYDKTLERLQRCELAVTELTKLHKEWVPGSPPDLDVKYNELIDALSEIQNDLEEHSRYEEKEIIPVLYEHAGEIINRGLVLEHEKILDSITYLRKSAESLYGKVDSRDQRIAQEVDVREAIRAILQLVQRHCDTQYIIYGLAKDVLSNTNELDKRRGSTFNI